MEITEALISDAEAILLPAGCSFDEERRNFIKRLDSCDLLSVPGSGKTTALQAKLYCMAQQMPLPQGAGIAVLSHTNVAVKELSTKLNRFCPQLFRYPNFVGTVQDFVDTFLAMPCYKMCFKHGIEIIDDERYKEAVECHHFPQSKMGNPTYWVKNHYSNEIPKLRFSIDVSNKCYLVAEQGGNPFTISPPHKWVKEGNVEAKMNEVMNNLKSMKLAIMNKGVLCYDDCYFLAQVYLLKYPKVKDIIRKRFPFVFIDETQDMRNHQLSIIDDIFDSPDITIQRIGDINQSIYSQSGTSADCEWHPRNKCFINRSLRLTDSIANVVNCFTCEKGTDANGNAQFVVTGGRTLENGDIPPYLILYDYPTKDQLQSKFEEIIRFHNLWESVEGRKYGFHIVGWNAKATGNTDKLHLEDIFPNYSHKADLVKVDRTTLNLHIQTGAKKNDTKSCYHLVLDIICHVLHLINKKRDNGRLYTPKTLTSDLQNVEVSKRDQINKLILMVTKNLSEAEYEAVYVDLAHVLHRLLGCPKDYIGNGYTPIIAAVANPVVSVNDHHIEIGTVHAAKGQTHCATMYVETCYEGKYESEHVRQTTKKKGVMTVHSPFFGEAFIGKGVYDKQTARMLYVGLSRPTHLLCYASLSSLWDDDAKQKMRNHGWQVIELN